MIDKVAVFTCFAILVVSTWTESKQKKVMHCPEEVSVIYVSENQNKTAVWPESIPTIVSRSSSASCSSTSSFSSKVEDLSMSESAGKGMDINSQPPCFSHYDSLVTRRCVQFSASSSPQWIPRDPPTCQEQMSDVNPCPSPFRSFRKGPVILCILVTDPQPWTSLCLTTGTILSILDLPKTQILDILQDLDSRNITTIWLPAKRDHPYGPILRKLPGILWGELYPHKYFETLSSKNWKLTEECLKMELWNKTDFILSTANCTENHPMLCLMSRNDEREHLQLACPDGYRTSGFYNEQNRCFKIVKEKAKNRIIYSEARNYCGEGAKLLKLTSVSFKRLIKEMGSKIGLKNDDKCWINEITNTSIHRSENIIAGNANAITIGGRFLQLDDTARLHCVLCEVDAQIPVPEMSLRYIAEEKLLQLNVYSSSGLWRESSYHDGFTCFTDAGQGFVTKVKAKFRESNHWTTASLKAGLTQRSNNKQVKLHFDVHKTTYKLKFFKKRAGNYWCEGHRVSSFEKIMSNKVLVIGKTRGHVYSLIIDQHNKCGINMTAYEPTFIDNFKHIEKEFIQNFPKALFSEIRVMRVLNVNNESTLRLALHLTPKFITGSIQHDFERINNITEKYVLKMGSRYEKMSLLSIYGCIPPIHAHSSDSLHWNFTYLGATSVPVELCVGDEGLPIYRKCLGDFSTGGYWGPVSGSCSQRHVTDATRVLHDLVTNSSGSVATDGRSVAHNVSLITSFPEDLSPADIYFVACVVRNLAQSSTFNKSGGRNISNDIVVVSQIFNQFSRADDHKVMLSQKHLNSSSMFLDYIDALFDQVSSRIYYSDEHSGVLSAITPYLMIQIIDPVKTNVTGLALIRRETEYSTTDTDFSQFDVVPLTAYHRLDDVLSIQNIEAAVWVPKNLIDMISNSGAILHSDQQRNTGDSLMETAQRHRIVITLLYKDIMFQNSIVDREDSIDEEANDTNFNPPDVTVVGSRIVSVTIAGVSQNLPLPIPIIFRPLLKSKYKSCAFWDFSFNSSTTSSSLGGWSDEGCVYAGNYSYGDAPSDDTDSQVDVCVCTHLTHFAELVVGRYGYALMSQGALSQDILWAEQHDRALDVITYLGCSLSLFGIGGIIVTAILFRTWRQKPGSKVLLQLSLAVAGQMILLMMSGAVKGGDDTEGVDPSCVLLGACLQYITLAAFSWMFVTALFQFLRYVRVLGPTRPPRFFMKSMLFGWGAPLLPVVLTVSISPESYQLSTICYPSGIALYLGVLLPILFVLLPNLAVFVLVINNIVRGPDGKVRPPTDKKLLISQLRLCVLLFFLLGLSWLFGLLAASRSAIIFAYLFCLAATLQGFVMFIFFVVCDPSTRKLWYSFLTSWNTAVELKRNAGGSQAELTCSTVSTCASTCE
ncbi:uncharacterized protein [Anabrus simplex]|uniref:uncharacterized protein n=1 Tax=Anabrus simplex TaxID=316456 RepID=UPI0035A3984C